LRSGLGIISLVAVLSLGSNLSASDTEAIFSQANEFYESKEYDSALINYSQLEKLGYHSAPLYFNMGNCYFKQGELGYAILQYLRAQRIDPNDDDINTNLAFARQFVPTQMEGVKFNPITQFFDMIVAPFTLDSIGWIASVLFIVFVLFLSAVIYFQWHSFYVRITAYALIVLLIAAAGMTTYKYRTEYLTEKGVIVADETQVYSAPADDSDLEFVGGFGLTFEIESSSGDYYKVIFENKRKGWVKKAGVEVI